MRGSIFPAAMLALVAIGGARAASPVTQSFRVSAAIVAGCSIATSGASSWGDINLGTIPGLGAATASAALVSPTGSGLQLNCTPGTAVTVTADTGLNAVAGVRQLALAGGTDRIPYQLFANGSATPWTTQPVALAFPVGTHQLGLPVTASTTVSAPRRAGNYSDVVRITVTW